MNRYNPLWHLITTRIRQFFREPEAIFWTYGFPLLMIVGLAGNVGASYAIFHGLTNFWAFQYLAWALPLWLAAGGRFALPAAVVATAYVWGLYGWLCGDPFLLGSWDWMGKPHWPTPVLALRDIAVAFFFASAVWLVARDGVGALFAVRSGR